MPPQSSPYMMTGPGAQPAASGFEMGTKFAPDLNLNRALNAMPNGVLDPAPAPDCSPKAPALWRVGCPLTSFIDYTNKFRHHGGQTRSTEANIQSRLAPLNIETKP